jgi:AraC family transcriptional regulator
MAYTQCAISAVQPASYGEAPAILYERVTGIIDGQVRPIPGLPLLSSAGSKGSGFLLEAHAVPASREEFGWSWHHTHVGLCIGGPSEIRISGAAGRGHFIARPGSVFIFPRGCGDTNFQHFGDRYRFVVVEIDTSRLERLFQDYVHQIDKLLTPQLYVPEPSIAALIGNMRAEFEAGSPSGPLYSEPLSLALAAYVSNRYAAKAAAVAPIDRKLSHIQARRVIDYIHARLDSDFSLVELASVVHLSSRHFSRLFRNTFGTTPHRYVMIERLKRAKELLAASTLSLVEIAECTGFASQSHFTDVFHAATGVTPRYYRDTR